MNYKTNNTDIEALKAQLNKLSGFRSDEDKLDLETEAIHLDIMHTVRGLMDENRLTKRDLAERLNTSPSYITQLFTGDKLVNLRTLAKIQRALSVRFEVHAERVFDVSKLSTSKINAIEDKVNIWTAASLAHSKEKPVTQLTGFINQNENSEPQLRIVA